MIKPYYTRHDIALAAGISDKQMKDWCDICEPFLRRIGAYRMRQLTPEQTLLFCQYLGIREPA